MVSAAGLGPERGLLALHFLPHRSPGQTQAGFSTGKAGAGASEQWAQVAEKAGVREQREGRKWPLPQPSPHPTSWTEGRWDWCWSAKELSGPVSDTHPSFPTLSQGPAYLKY